MATGYTLTQKEKLTSLPPLRFSKDGSFKILHITDIHKVHPLMDDDIDRTIPEKKNENTLNTISKAIEKTSPDLVVFGGDNIGGHWDEMTDEFALWCLQKIIGEVKKFNVPLAVVFGNHDGQNEHIAQLLSREIQMSIYMGYDNFRGCFNEADVYGCGNYHLPVLKNNSDEVMWNIWCFDSNDYPRKADRTVISYDADCVHSDQLQWYENTVKKEKEQFGKTIPAVLFQHMPVNQVFDFIEECDEKDSDYEHSGKFFRAKDGAIKSGRLLEKPCPPMEDRKEFQSWVKCGDIKAAFFGHDHINSFCFEKDGIELYQTIGCGYETYGNDHGGRLITLYENGTYETETVIIPPKFEL
ncbi:MAG: metallophosphoesterase [Clostridia bacterium]|nr:metallophosphoesterase [Clostridia bacterium]